MFEWVSLFNLAIIGVSLQFGGMAYFAFIFSPMIFKFMESGEASKFLRQVFPAYYRLSAAISIFPAVMLISVPSFQIEVGTLLAVAAMFLFAARILVPMSNSARDSNNDKKFRIIHRVSVSIYIIQWLAIFVILIRLVS
jgi:hypothetical protein